MTATKLPPAAEPAGPAAGEHTADAVIAAARDLARRWQHTPKWRERLTGDAVALVEAVLEHDRTETTR